MGKVTVNIYGQEYVLSGDRPEDEIRMIASKVDETMTAIKAGGNFNSTVEVAVLTALTLGEEALDTEKKISQAEDGKAQAKEEAMAEYESEIAELNKRISEYESNFFDLQMQNIKLKNELDRLKGNNNL